MVQHAVEYRVRNDGVSEDLSPSVEALIRREHRGMPLISHRYELEQQIGVLSVDRQEPDLVDDEHAVGREMLQPPRQRVLMLRLLELHDQVVAVHEVGHVPAFCALDADGHGEMGLPGAGRPHEDDVLRALHEPEVPQIQNLIPVQPRLIAEIVVVERLHEREMRDHDHGPVHPVLAEGHLLLREGIEGVHQIRLAAVDLVYEGVYVGSEGGQLQGIEVVDQLDVV